MSNGNSNAGSNCNRVYSSIHEYCEDLRRWLWFQQRAFSPPVLPPVAFTPPGWYHHLPSSLPTYLSNGQIIIPGAGDPGRIAAPVQTPAQQQPPGTLPAQEFMLPKIWQRGVAEFIDFLLALVVKVIISLVFLNNFRLLHEESMDFDLFYAAVQARFSDRQVERLLTLTTDMLTTQMIHRFFTAIVEAVCLHRGLFGGIGGSTPGKLVMGLRVVGCDDVIDLGPDRGVLLIHPRNLGFLAAFNRSLFKNFSIWFFVPIILSVYFLDHQRAIYDMAAGSIVVCAPSAGAGAAAAGAGPANPHQGQGNVGH